MKFLLFNLAVAAALVFLFTVDHGEIQRFKEQAHNVADELKSRARETLNDNMRLKDSVSGESVGSLTPSWPSYADNPPVMNEPMDTTNSAAGNKFLKDPPREIKPSDNAVPQEAVVTTKLAKLGKVIPQISRESGTSVAGKLDTDTGTPALQEGAKLMTASERRQELMSLAEEMELLYARSIIR